MHIPAMICLLSLLLVPGSTSAKIRFPDWRDSPQKFASKAEAIEKLRRSFGDELFDRLRKSRRIYTIVFETDEDFEKAIISEDDSAELKARTKARIRIMNAYFEKDMGTSGRFTIHLNKNALERLKKAYLDAHPALNEPAKKRIRAQLLKNVVSNDLTDSLAHEARHARQTEDNELGFLEAMVAPKIHDGIAHDRYDEREGYLAGLEALLRPGAEQKATAAADKAYPSLKTRFLIVKDGKEAEGKAPYAWGAADAKTSLSSFVAHVMADHKSATPPADASRQLDAKSATSSEGVDMGEETSEATTSPSEEPNEQPTDEGPASDDPDAEVDPDWVSPNQCGTFLHSGEVGDFPVSTRETADAKSAGSGALRPSRPTDPSASKMDPEPE